MTHREIKEPVPLVGARGRLNPEAAAWARNPVVDTSALRPRFGTIGATKRWEYWVITTPTHVLTVDVSTLGYLALQQVWLLDRRTGDAVADETTRPLGVGLRLPRTYGDQPTRAKAGRMRVSIRPEGSQTRMTIRAPRIAADLMVTRWPVQEALCVVVPWSPKRYHYTLKHIGYQVAGRIVADGQEIEVPLEGSSAVHDHGRGLWPHAVHWEWAAGAGALDDGRRFGLTIGGSWTVGTPSTENGFFVEGRLHKVQEEAAWDYDRRDRMRPWAVYSSRFTAEFSPYYSRADSPNLGVLAGEVNETFGTWSGEVVLDDGSRAAFHDVEGFAEDASFRW